MYLAHRRKKTSDREINDNSVELVKVNHHSSGRNSVQSKSRQIVETASSESNGKGKKRHICNATVIDRMTIPFYDTHKGKDTKLIIIRVLITYLRNGPLILEEMLSFYKIVYRTIHSH